MDRITTKLPDDVKKWFTEEAKSREVSRETPIREACIDYMNKVEKRRKSKGE